MPYKPINEYKPVKAGEMLIRRYEGHHTICQFFRDIYHMTKDPEIKVKCKTGMAITKAMHVKLKECADKAREIEKEGKDAV